MVRTIVMLCAAAAVALPLSAACDQFRYFGRSGDEILFVPITAGVVSDRAPVEAGTPLLALSVNGSRAVRRWLPPRALSTVAGSGRSVWVAVPAGSRPTAVTVWSLDADGSDHSQVRIELPFEATSLSWSEDKGGAWLFFAGSREASGTIAAFRRDAHGWTMNDLVPASLTPPQYDPATDTIIVDGWRFARRKPASRLPVPRPHGTSGFPIIANVAALPSGLLLGTAGGKAWSSADGGTTWKPLAVPWPEASAGNVQRVAGDSNRAVFVYRKDSDPCVPRSKSSNETILVEWTGSWRELHQPPPKDRYHSPFALTEEGVVVIGECDGADSRVDRIQVMRATPEGWQIRDVLVVDGR